MFIMSKYPKTITYEVLDGNKKTTVVKDEFEQRVLENQIEKQMQLKSELDVASEVFSYRMDALRGKNVDDLIAKRKILEKGKKRKEELQKRVEEKAKSKEDWDKLTTSQKISQILFVLLIFLFCGFVFIYFYSKL
tara:strand:- start:188 stop:592 length:405 start_codon:yes stop_codon:yes gene_type:complete